eukprot:838608-Rhodomonas_salina.2
MATHDKYTYTLKGVGEDPVAEDHVPVLCVARKRVECTLRVRNTLARQVDPGSVLSVCIMICQRQPS